MPITQIPLPYEGLASVLDGLSIPTRKLADCRNVRLERNHIERGPGGTQFAPVPVLSTSPGFRVGSFTKQTGTGAQVVTHALGATPVALILWTNSVEELGPAEQNLRYSIGATDGAGVTASRGNRSVAVASRSETLPTNTYRRRARKLLTILTRGTGAVASECDWSAWGSTSFTVDWTTNNGDPEIIFYLIFGGTGMAATLTAWDANATGAVATNHNLGITPVLALTFHAGTGTADTDSTSDGLHLGFGASDSAGNQFTQAISILDNSTAETAFRRVFEAQHTITAIEANDRVIRAEHTSFSSTQFTYNFGILSAASRFFTLAISGITAEVQSPNLPGAAELISASYSTTFEPHAIIFGLTRSLNSEITSEVKWSLGATDTTIDRVAAIEAVPDGNLSRKHSHRQLMAIDQPIPGSQYPLLRANFQAVTAIPSSYSIIYNRNLTGSDVYRFGAIPMRFEGALADMGRPRNLFHFRLSDDGEKYIMLTNLKAFVYNSTTGVFVDQGESYAANEDRRYSIASINNLMIYSQRALDVGGVNTIRTYDGTTFANLITTGQNHSANIILAFNDRIVSGDTRYDPGSGTITSFNTQIRWSMNGNYNNWSGRGSGTLLIEETSNEPLVAGFVLGDRAYLGKKHEIVELIATGLVSPVFRQESRVRGLGVLARHSVALGESVVFFMGPDDVYAWDGGGRPERIGGDVYKTIREQIDYQRLNEVQGIVYTPENLYILLTGYNLGGNLWGYDYRRDRWFRDNFQDIRALGLFDVGTQFSTDIDASSFIIIADSDGTTWRLDDTVLTYRSIDMDSYFETRDFPSQVVAPTDQGQALIPTQARMTTLKRVFLLVGDNTDPFDVSVSADEGRNWTTTTATPGIYGLAIAHFTDGIPFMTLRVRVRSISDDDFIIRAMSYEWTDGGEAEAADTVDTAPVADPGT